LKRQGPLRLATPAKFTPLLRVLRRRGDGFHEVVIVLAPISLCDTLTFRFGGAPIFDLTCEGGAELGPPEDNLVLRAARTFAAAVERPLGARIRLEKRIPAGAGLGGGSGNAAATLLALNAAHGYPLGPAALARLAATLGSDVPFFLNPVPTVARGRGELLEPLPVFPRLPLLVVRPPFAVSTAAAYGWVRPDPTERPLPLLSTPAEVVAALENAFEAAVFPRHPVLAEIREALRAAGAAGAVLSGTGSAMVGIFADAEARERAVHALAGQEAWALFPCETLPSFTYALPPRSP